MPVVLRFLSGSLAAVALVSAGTADGESLHRQAAAGMDHSPVTLSEALTQQRSDRAEVPTGEQVSGLDPDSPQVLEEEAREGNSEALAKQAQNPIASLISFPIQWNSTPGSQWAPRALDPSAQRNRTFNLWNVQPVVPFPLNDNLTLISRTIVPVIQRPLAGDTDGIGIGDINPTLFLVPRTRGHVQVGFGPTLVIPSATDVQLSSQRWSAGPAAVVVYTRGPLVGGMLINNIWSFAGAGGQDINAMLIQPFFNYNLSAGWYLISSPIITADWNAANGKGWSVPLGGGIGRIFRIGTQPFNASLQAFWNVVKPEVLGDQLTGDFTVRLQIQALFPTGR
ncbi:MAG: neuromedin U [Cyanobium sp.]